MTKCKLCNKNLYEKINFSNVFKINYSVHINCINKLIINNDRIAFPFYNKIIYYDYLIYDVNPTYNIEYIEHKYLSILYTRNMKNIDWSIIIFYEDGLFNQFCDNDLEILFSLANFPVLIISVIFYDMGIIFKDNY